MNVYKHSGLTLTLLRLVNWVIKAAFRIRSSKNILEQERKLLRAFIRLFFCFHVGKVSGCVTRKSESCFQNCLFFIVSPLLLFYCCLICYAESVLRSSWLESYGLLLDVIALSVNSRHGFWDIFNLVEVTYNLVVKKIHGKFSDLMI